MEKHGRRELDEFGTQLWNPSTREGKTALVARADSTKRPKKRNKELHRSRSKNEKQTPNDASPLSSMHLPLPPNLRLPPLPLPVLLRFSSQILFQKNPLLPSLPEPFPLDPHPFHPPPLPFLLLPPPILQLLRPLRIRKPLRLRCSFLSSSSLLVPDRRSSSFLEDESFGFVEGKFFDSTGGDEVPDGEFGLVAFKTEGGLLVGIGFFGPFVGG